MYKLIILVKYLTLTTGALLKIFLTQFNANGMFLQLIDLRITKIAKSKNAIPSFEILVRTCGVDAFAFDWSDENNWLVPPIGLVSRVINHLCLCNAKGALVVPKWKSVLFWPMIWNDTKNCFHNFVKDSIEFYRPRNLFVIGSDKDSVFAKSPFISNVIVLKIDFSG